MLWSIAPILLLLSRTCAGGTIEESMRTKRVIAYLKDPPISSSHTDFSRYERKKVVETFHHIVKKILPPYPYSAPNETRDWNTVDTETTRRRVSLKQNTKKRPTTSNVERKRRDIDLPELFDFEDVEEGGRGDVLSEFGGYSVKMLDEDVPNSSSRSDDPESEVVEPQLTDRPLLQEWTAVKEPGELDLKNVPAEPFETSNVKNLPLNSNLPNRPFTEPFGIPNRKDLNSKQDYIISNRTFTKTSSSKEGDLSNKPEDMVKTIDLDNRVENVPFEIAFSKEIDLDNEQDDSILNSLPTESIAMPNLKDLLTKHKDMVLNTPSTEIIEIPEFKVGDLLNKQKDMVLNTPSPEILGIPEFKVGDLFNKQKDVILNTPSNEIIGIPDFKERGILRNQLDTTVSTKTIGIIDSTDRILTNMLENPVFNRLATEPIEPSNSKEYITNKQDYGLTTETPDTSREDNQQEDFATSSSPSNDDVPSTTKEDLTTTTARDCGNSTDEAKNATASCNHRKRKNMRKTLREHAPKTYIVQIQGESRNAVVTSDMDLLRSLLLPNASSELRREATAGGKPADDDSRVLLLWVLGSVLLLGIVVISRRRSFISKQ